MKDRAFDQEVRMAFEGFAPATDESLILTAPLWVPNPGKQTEAYYSLADITGYGGAGGGGKTDLVLGLCTTAHRSSVVFRAEFTQFRGPEGMIERSKEIIGQNGRLNEHTFQWRGLPGGRSFEFAGVKTDKDLGKWRGRPHDLKCFDELPEFKEHHFLFLIGWRRTNVVGQRTRVVVTFNPPSTPEGQWVIRFFAPWLDKNHPNPAKEGELRWYAVIDGKDQERPDGTKFYYVKADGTRGRADCDHEPNEIETACVKCSAEYVKPQSRTFIRARVEDNPHYLRTGYIDVLNALPEPLRSQLRYGDFEATQEDDPWQVIPTAWVRAAQLRWQTTPKPDVPLSAVGCDPSRGGKDKFTLAPRWSNWVDEVKKHDAKEAPDGQAGVKLVVAFLRLKAGPARDIKSVTVNIDIIGSAGSSVFDQARDLELNVVGLNGSERTEALDQSGRLRFWNKRAEWHWRMREWLDPNSGQDVCLPPDPELLADLCAPRWRITPRGIKIEEKADIKERIGRSPDTGEAVIYAFAEDGGNGFGFLKWATDQVHAAAVATAETPAEPRERRVQTPDEDDNPWLAALPPEDR